MNQSTLFTAALLAAAALGACGKAPVTTPAAPVDDFVPPSAPKSGIQIHVNPFTVKPGKEVLMCTFTDTILGADAQVIGVDGFQRKGGHHTIVFATAPGMTRRAGTAPCNDEDMANYQFRLVGAGGAEGDSTGIQKGYHFPPGIGQTIPKGSQVVVQSHYVNATDGDLKAEDFLNVLYAEPGTIKFQADAFAITSLVFSVPAGKKLEVEVPCEITDDLNVIYMLGHTHEWGTRFTMTLEDAGKVTSLYDEPGGINLQFHPPTIQFPPETPLVLKKGQKVKVKCSWDNTTDHDLKFPEEMCASLMFYYPARGFLTCTEADARSH